MLNQSDTVGTEEMIGDKDANLDNLIDKFKNKSFDDKKKEIFEYLDDMKEKKVVKKSEENLKLDLKNEYVGDESTDNKSDKKLKYIGIAAVIVVIIGAGVLLKRCRKSQ